MAATTSRSTKEASGPKELKEHPLSMPSVNFLTELTGDEVTVELVDAPSPPARDDEAEPVVMGGRGGGL